MKQVGSIVSLVKKLELVIIRQYNKDLFSYDLSGWVWYICKITCYSV